MAGVRPLGCVQGGGGVAPVEEIVVLLGVGPAEDGVVGGAEVAPAVGEGGEADVGGGAKEVDQVGECGEGEELAARQRRLVHAVEAARVVAAGVRLGLGEAGSVETAEPRDPVKGARPGPQRAAGATRTP